MLGCTWPMDGRPALQRSKGKNMNRIYKPAETIERESEGWVLAYRYDEKAIRSKADKVKRKAINLGIPMPVLEIETAPNLKYVTGEGATRREKTIPAMWVRWYAPRPIVIGGAKLLGVIHTQERITAAVPGGDPLPAGLADTPGTRCDHCHTARQRNKLVVLKTAEGGTAIVGASCSKDYLGHDLAPYLSYLAVGNSLTEEVPDFLDELDARLTRGDAPRCLGEWIAHCWTDIRRRGYRKADTGWSTKQAALHAIAEGEQPNGADVKDIIEWAAELPGANQFERNMKQIARNGYVTSKSMGIAAYMPEAWARAKAKEKAKELAAAEDKGHIGTVGERIAVTATVTDCHWHENDWGYFCWVTARTETGQVVKWRTSKDIDASGDPIGQTWTGKATIKEHGTWQGGSQTIVTRWSYQQAKERNNMETTTDKCRCLITCATTPGR